MKRTRPSLSSRTAPGIQRLVREARSLGYSSCRLEDGFWESRLSSRVDELLKAGDDGTLNGALDELYRSGDRGYEDLADIIESRCESHTTKDGTDLLLIALPVLAWSRFAIPSGPIPQDILNNVRVQLQAHVLGRGAQLALADVLFSPDQLPVGFSETARFTGRMGRAAEQSQNLHLDPGLLPETMSFLSDTRYLIGAIAQRHGNALFRWQEEDGGDRDQVRHQWQRQGGEALRPLFPGCAVEAQLPAAYFSACREADRNARPYALKASIAFLNTAINAAPSSLEAIAAPFHDPHLIEYRVGFTVAGQTQVLHGVVWPLLDGEDENSDVPSQIEGILKETGVTNFRYLDHAFPAEYCEDCGTPLYPNPEGEIVHAELPEEQSNATPRHLH